MNSVRSIISRLIVLSSLISASALANSNLDLIEAAGRGDLRAAKTALSQGADINFFSAHPNFMFTRSALEDAVGGQHQEMIEFLLKKGADANLQNDDGMSALDKAVQRDNLSAVALLIDSGGLVNPHRPIDAPLHHAASGDLLQIAEYLVAHGATIDFKNYLGETPLFIAMSDAYLNQGRLGVANLLLERKANVNLAANNQRRPLHYAAKGNTCQGVKLLISHGAEINVQDEAGQSPLHLAAASGNIDIVKILVGKGTNMNLKDREGNTPLHLAARDASYSNPVEADHKNAEVAECLLQAGARGDIKNGDGQTAAEVAKKMLALDKTDPETRRVSRVF